MTGRFLALLLFGFVAQGSAAAQEAGAVRPYLPQGFDPANPVQPRIKHAPQFVAPQFALPDPRDIAVPAPDINKKRPRKLLPQDGDIRLRQQKGELPRVPQLSRTPQGLTQ